MFIPSGAFAWAPFVALAAALPSPAPSATPTAESTLPNPASTAMPIAESALPNPASPTAESALPNPAPTASPTAESTLPNPAPTASPTAESAAPNHATAAVETSSDASGAAALFTDLERIVTSVESGGWYLDRAAHEEIYSMLLESVCRASLAARSSALEAARRRAEAAGNPRRVFAEQGRKVTARFERALSATRMLDELQTAIQGAENDCPFWQLPRLGFQSRQTDQRRWTLVVETGGNIQLRQTAGSWTFGGGGLGRILPSYGIGEHASFLFGIEFGGGAMLRPNSPQTEFVVNYFPALPFVLRLRVVNFRYDIETGPVALFQADNTRFSYGARIGTSLGVLALRTRNFIPWAGIATTYEYYFAGGGRPAAHFVRGGLRVGITWGP